MLPPPWPGEVVTLANHEVFVRRTPAQNSDAEPALYVHGLGAASGNWTDLAGQLADRFRGIALDLPGFGQSPPRPHPRARYTVPGFAETVKQLIDYEATSGVHLIGNSLGGAIALRVATHHPELVRSLTLISPAMPFLNPTRSSYLRYLPLALVPGGHRVLTWQFRRLPIEQVVRERLAASRSPHSPVSEQRFAETVESARLWGAKPWFGQATVGSFRGMVGGFLRAYLPGGDSPWRAAARVRVPTLVIWGELDQILDPGLARPLAAVLPHSRLLMLPKVGHSAHAERPAEVAAAIRQLVPSKSHLTPAGRDQP